MILSIKQLIKQITPPIIWDAIRRLFICPKAFVTYEGHFTSFDEVYQCYPEATNYHSSASETVEFDTAVNKLRQFEMGDLPEYNLTLSRLNFLPILLCLYPIKKINILDIGGGLGATFIDLMYSLSKKNVLMKVVELPSISVRGRELFTTYPNISFIDALPDTSEYFDVVYFGSSLQYFENFRNLLGQAADLKPDIIAISDTSMGDAPTFVVAQVNMPGRVIPRMVFNLTELVQLLSTKGYDLLHRTRNYSHEHNFTNYDAPISTTGRWNLVFRRTNS